MEIGVQCSRGFITHEECRKCALNPLHPCGYPPDLLEMMRGENSAEPTANSFTPSRLLNICDRQSRLYGRSDYYIQVDKQLPLVRGHMVHALFENRPVYPGILSAIREVRLEYDLPAARSSDSGDVRPDDSRICSSMYTGPTDHFTGKSDFIGILKQDGNRLSVKVVDYKTTKYISAKMLDLTQDAKGRQYIMQVNMYAWLVRHALAKALQRDVEVDVEEVEIVFFDMERVVRFTSAGDITFKGRTYRALPLL